MKKIIFLRHLPYIWDNGKHMIKHTDYLALLMLGKALNIDVILHSTRRCDYISALALNQGCNSKALIQDEYLMNPAFLKPSHFLEELRQTTNNNGLDTFAIVAGRQTLEILGCPALRHGEFYIKYEKEPTSSDHLVRGSIEDFRQACLEETQIIPKAIDNLY